MDAIAALGYFSAICPLRWRRYFDKGTIGYALSDFFVAVSQYNIRQFPERFQLIRSDVAQILLLKTMHKHGSASVPEKKDASRAAGLAFAVSGYPLLDNTPPRSASMMPALTLRAASHNSESLMRAFR
jgi:hypothetical protein